MIIYNIKNVGAEMAIIHERIKERRRSLGMTLAQLADLTGVKEATAQRWESGAIKTLKYDTVETLANALRCTPQYLMGWETEETLPISNNEERLNEELIGRLVQLTPEELEKVDAFVQGLLASRST